jgi:hypothetical protein
MAVVVAVLVVVLVATRGGGDDPADRLARVPAAVDAAGRAHLSMDVEASGTHVDGDGAVDFGSGAGWFVVQAAGQRIEMRTDARTVYVLPSAGSPWLAVPIDESASLGSFGTGPSEAVAFVDLFRGEVEEVSDLGTERIGEVDTTHLRAEIDLTRAVAAAPARSAAAIEALGTLVAEGERLVVHVWVDDQDRPVRERLSGEVESLAIDVTVDLSAWGDELGVAIPPEGEVRDASAEEIASLFGTVAG